MPTTKLLLLRGICQIPAYAAHELGFFREEGVDVEVDIAPTAGLAPRKLADEECQFAVMPWTRVAAAPKGTLVLLSGSGIEEAAIVVRTDCPQDKVQRVVVPLRGGIKDLTAMGMIRSLGWEDVEFRRQPSGDGAIIAFFGQGADAASMVEPYATMMEELGVGRVVRRTGDLWKGAPGCSLATTVAFKDREPEVVAGVVRAFLRGTNFVREEPDQAAELASAYIGINPRFIRKALDHNCPNADAIRNHDAMGQVLQLMVDLQYVDQVPTGFADLSFLDAAQH